MKQDVGFYLHCEGPNLGKKPRVSRPTQPLSSYYKDVLASRLSPHTRTSVVTNPRQLAPTVGFADGGDEFLEGSRRDQEVHNFPNEEYRVFKKLGLQSVRCRRPAIYSVGF